MPKFLFISKVFVLINYVCSSQGIHITTPFLALLMKSTTTYFTLLALFELLYVDLATIKPESFLSINQVWRFSTANRFTQPLPSECLQRNLSQATDDYKLEILRIINITLPIIAEGFFSLKRSYTWIWANKQGSYQLISNFSMIFSGFPGNFPGILPDNI